MTSVIQLNFERFSQFMCLDAMTNKTNVGLFPDMSIIVLGEMNKVSVRCEALVMHERIKLCIFVVKSSFEMAPHVHHHGIK